MESKNINPLFLGEFTSLEKSKVCNLLVDSPHNIEVEVDLLTSEIMSGGIGLLAMFFPHFTSEREIGRKRLVFAYYMSSELNAFAEMLPNHVAENTFLAKVSIGLVMEIVQTTKQIVESLGKALVIRPFNLPKTDESFSSFANALSIMTVHFVFLHEFVHLTRDHLSIFSRLFGSQKKQGIFEKLGANEVSSVIRDNSKIRIYRAMEAHADLVAARLFGSIYHFHHIGPDGDWFGGLRERHKLIACEITPLVFSYTFSKINSSDSLIYQSPFKRGVDALIELVHSTRNKSEDIEELLEDFELFLTCLHKDQRNTLFPSEEYITGLPLPRHVNTHRDVRRLIKFGIIEEIGDYPNREIYEY
jgi:hypothetical protein